MKLFERMKHNNFALFVLVVLLVMPLVFVSGGCDGSSSSDFSAPQKAHRTYKIKTGGEFKVLQLTDIHLTGAPENIADIQLPGTKDKKDKISAYDRDMMALETIDAVIKKAKPDFIAVTGDLAFVNAELELGSDGVSKVDGTHRMSVGHNDNMQPIKRFVEKIESYNIPWAMVYGNHDGEGIHNRDEIGNYLESQKNCVFEKGPEDVYGVGNYIINVENSDGTINKALVFIDSHSYIPGHSGLSDLSMYDHIRADQMEWYGNQIEGIAKEYSMEKMPESFCFWHIPLVEYKTAWDALKFDPSGDANVYQRVNFPETVWVSGMNHEGVCHPNLTSEDGGHMFEKILEVGSTKAIFCGHDHVNFSNIIYKGVNLIYGKSIDYGAAYAPLTCDTQRGGTLIHIKDGGEWEVERIDFNGGLYEKLLKKRGLL